MNQPGGMLIVAGQMTCYKRSLNYLLHTGASDHALIINNMCMNILTLLQSTQLVASKLKG
jgi:hypothetical protein